MVFEAMFIVDNEGAILLSYPDQIDKNITKLRKTCTKIICEKCISVGK